MPVQADVIGLGQQGDTASIRPHAAQGIATPASSLPHAAKIQASFGQHDISSVRSHQGGAASKAAVAMAANAYATGLDTAFASTPSLHTAAHEADHVIQHGSSRIGPYR